MVPELRRRFPDIGEPLELPPEQQRRYFFNAVGVVHRARVEAVSAAARDGRRPLGRRAVAAVDRAHGRAHARAAGARRRHVPRRRARRRPSARGDARAPRAGADRGRVSVKRFDRDAVAVMLGALAGKAPPEAIVGAVFDETEGNAFFVEEVFWHLVEERKIFDESGDFRSDLEVNELDVPESVRLVVGRRLERLGPEAQRVLAAGAVVGRGVPFHAPRGDHPRHGRLAAARHHGGGRGRPDHRSRAARRRDPLLVRARAHPPDAAAGLSMVRRQRLHLAIADAIERTDRKTATPARRRSPITCCRRGGADVERTLGYLERTADRALESAAFEEALRRSTTRWRWSARTTRAAGHGCWSARVGRSARSEGSRSASRSGRTSFPSTSRPVTSRPPRAVLRDRLPVRLVGRFADALAVDCARPRRARRAPDTDARRTLMSATATVVGLAGFFDRPNEQFAAAIELARELATTAPSAGWSGVARCRTGRRKDGGRDRRAATRPIEHLRRADDAWTLVDALGWASFPLLFGGVSDEGRPDGPGGREPRREARSLAGETLAAAGPYIADFFDAARPRGVRAHARRGSRCGSRASGSPWASQSHAWLASILMLRGDLEGSVTRAEEAIELEPESAWAGLGRRNAPGSTRSPATNRRVTRCWPKPRPAPGTGRPRDDGQQHRALRAGCRVRMIVGDLAVPRRSTRQWRSRPTGSRSVPSISPSGTGSRGWRRPRAPGTQPRSTWPPRSTPGGRNAGFGGPAAGAPLARPDAARSGRPGRPAPRSASCSPQPSTATARSACRPTPP